MAQAVPARPLRKRLLLGSVVLHVGSRPLLKRNILPTVATPFTAAAAVSGQALSLSLSLSSARTSQESLHQPSLILSVQKEKKKKKLRHSLFGGCNIEDAYKGEIKCVLCPVSPVTLALWPVVLGWHASPTDRSSQLAPPPPPR